MLAWRYGEYRRTKIKLKAYFLEQRNVIYRGTCIYSDYWNHHLCVEYLRNSKDDRGCSKDE